MLAQGAFVKTLSRRRNLLLQERDEIEHFVLFLRRQLKKLLLNPLYRVHFIFLTGDFNEDSPQFDYTLLFGPHACSTKETRERSTLQPQTSCGIGRNMSRQCPIKTKKDLRNLRKSFVFNGSP